jgi:hypothetical protein
MTCQQCLALYLGLEVPVTTRGFRAAVIAHLVGCEGCLTENREMCLPHAFSDLTFAPLWSPTDFIDAEFVSVVGRADRKRRSPRRSTAPAASWRRAHRIRVWPVPAPVTGSAADVQRWLTTLTGHRLDAGGAVEAVKDETPREAAADR